MKTESAVAFPGSCRLHVALTVSDLEASKRFYELLTETLRWLRSGRCGRGTSHLILME